ncbi:hypothetical protein PEDI_19080 [Persicobacter diffluens]|uniref:Uncharacterized protein n=1 Tax=Persicobacter diffluens TaxID=981 RepID=A0AAN4VWL6_9BACT|nr:hypothetical protein PEDI_19080 [Persicobacter diffluens]
MLPFAPLLILQGKKVKAKVPKINPAKGESGHIGSGKPLKLLCLVKVPWQALGCLRIRMLLQGSFPV